VVELEVVELEVVELEVVSLREPGPQPAGEYGSYRTRTNVARIVGLPRPSAGLNATVCLSSPIIWPGLIMLTRVAARELVALELDLVDLVDLVELTLVESYITLCGAAAGLRHHHRSIEAC
jgi:hypothetical protein